MAPAEWRRRRSELTHDWLRNRFMPHVAACLAIGSGAAEAPAAAVAAFVATVHEWPARSSLARQLADTYCEAMSPALQVAHLTASLAEGVATYVQEAAVAQWRYRIDALLAEVRDAQQSADNAYARWVEVRSDDLTTTSGVLGEMLHEAERLAKALSRLPVSTA
jgi:hypothetical protein